MMVPAKAGVFVDRATTTACTTANRKLVQRSKWAVLRSAAKAELLTCNSNSSTINSILHLTAPAMTGHDPALKISVFDDVLAPVSFCISPARRHCRYLFILSTESTRITVPSILPTLYFFSRCPRRAFPSTVPQSAGLVHGATFSLFTPKTKANLAGKWRQPLIVPAKDRKQPAAGRLR
jgi:hypothetical protein